MDNPVKETVGGYLDKKYSGKEKLLYFEINPKAKIFGVKFDKLEPGYLQIYGYHEIKHFTPIPPTTEGGRTEYGFEVDTPKKKYFLYTEDKDCYQMWENVFTEILKASGEHDEGSHFSEPPDSDLPRQSPMRTYGLEEYSQIIKRAKDLTHHRMAYPRAEMLALYAKTTSEGQLEFTLNETEGTKFVDNTILGIENGGFLDYTNIQVGDPWAERKNHPTINHLEKEVIKAMGLYLGADPSKMKGYIGAGGTEGNMAGMWWSIRYVNQKNVEKIIQLEEEIEKLNQDESLPMETELKLLRASTKLSEIKRPIVYFTYKHTHYSIKKICELYDTDFIEIEGDDHGEMQLEQFKAEIDNHAKKCPHRSAIVFANIGTTMYGGIDNIPEINRILSESGLIYTIHADAALMGPALPIIKPFGDSVTNYFDDIGVNSMSISGHKFFGVSNVCGLALARKDFFKTAFTKSSRIGYVGDIHDSTIAGSRSGLNVVLLHHVLLSLKLNQNDNETIRMIVENNLRNAEYAYNQLVEIFGEQDVHWKPNSFAIVFKKPHEDIMKKYSLMPVFEDKAAIEVLQHVVREKIDSFLEDLRKI